MRVGFVFEGDLKASRGTPARIRNWINVASKKYEVSIYSPGIENYSNTILRSTVIELIENSDIVFFCNYNSIWKNRQLFQNSKHKTFVVDIHSLSSSEIKLKHPFIKLKEFIIENIARYIIVRNNIFVLSVNKKLFGLLLASFNRKKIIQGAISTDLLNLGPREKSNVDKRQIVKLTYAGNLRQYQGIDFFIKLVKRAAFRNLPISFEIITLDQQKELEFSSKNLTIKFAQHQETYNIYLKKVTNFLVPRPSTRLTRITFPSKIYEHLSLVDSNIFVSNSVPKLPIELESYIVRYNPKDIDRLLDLILKTAGNIFPEFNGTRFKVMSRHTWDVKFEEIILWTRGY